ncbi:MAG: AAA family ATPase [Sulfurovaceae bacterium]|nr:AAA family ATPase [Sulfurovaceae bacterium]
MNVKNEEDLAVTVEEIRAFRKEMLLMHGLLASDLVEEHSVVKEVSDMFTSKGLDRVWVDNLLASTIGSDFEKEKESLISYILDEIDKQIVAKNSEDDLSGKIHILIGQTGVGKTSLIGKLGARYRYLLDKSHKVAFCNDDRHKVGTTEQLSAYADAMEIPFLELQDIIMMDDFDVIFIDTAGTSGESLDELKSLLDELDGISEYQIEISLVLSATAKKRDMSLLVDAFDGFPIDNFMFTKLDETDDISDVICSLMHYDKPISYISKGQKIPEDVIIASNEYLLEKFMQER